MGTSTRKDGSTGHADTVKVSLMCMSRCLGIIYRYIQLLFIYHDAVEKANRLVAHPSHVLVTASCTSRICLVHRRETRLWASMA